MNRLLIAVLVGASLVVSAQAQQQSSETPLTNSSVIKLVKAGFKEKTVISIISNRPNRFNLDPDHLIELKRQGVSEDIILAMLAAEDATYVVEGEEWANDAFFKGVKRNDGGTSIFGSSGGSQSQSQSRTGSGGNENEGNVTGSATIRILKPPAEAGGAATAKLEKTPSLTNEGVIRLVEAGFSEGTIIKRIEESPVEFDLSPAKLEDLRKRRVTDAIIAAMHAAMGVEARPK